MTIGTSNVFTRKAVVGEIYLKDMLNTYKLVGGVDASQHDPFSICRDLSTGLSGATSLDSFLKLKAYKPSETKVFSLTSVLTVHLSSRIKSYLHAKPLSVN